MIGTNQFRFRTSSIGSTFFLPEQYEEAQQQRRDRCQKHDQPANGVHLLIAHLGINDHVGVRELLGHIVHRAFVLGQKPVVVLAEHIAQLGELAELPVEAVAMRFGNAGLRCHNIARARHDRKVAPPITHADWEVSHVPEEPILRVDAASFVARNLASRLHQLLSKGGVVCQLLKVTADFSTGDTVSRIWRTGEPLTEQATADRVRWQLDGWLTARGAHSDDPNEHDGITALWLIPLECVPPDMASGGLWDTGRSQQHVARQVIERVQSSLGVDAVLQPVPAGGRGVEERIHFVPYGEKRDAIRNPAGSWPGKIPGPLPARLGGGINHPASQVIMIDAEGQRIYVTAEALLSSSPYALSWGPARYLITGWAGPWPVDDRWWEKNGTKYARLQVVGRAVSEERQLSAWLLMWKDNKWRIEATY